MMMMIILDYSTIGDAVFPVIAQICVGSLKFMKYRRLSKKKTDNCVLSGEVPALSGGVCKRISRLSKKGCNQQSRSVRWVRGRTWG